MFQSSRQIGRGNDVGSISRQKNTRIKLVAPEAIVLLITFVWLVICIQLYRHGVVVHDGIVHDATPKTPQIDEQNEHAVPINRKVVVEPTTPDHYMTFSTACSLFQDWQSYMFFYYAHKVSQPGHIIRIASGCSQQQQDELLKFHDKVISKLSPNYSVHFTPDFSNVSGDDYKYYNKPFGLQHWLQHGLKYDDNKEKYNDAIFVVLDPDMMLLRPLTYDFTDSNIIIHKSIRGEPPIRKVSHGQPWASIYGFGDSPFRVPLNYVFANATDSPALSVTGEEQINNYAGGPPYMATGADMSAIVNKWCELVIRVHGAPFDRRRDDLLDEMFGWSLAVAHLSLPHTLVESFMISNTHVNNGEGWSLIDALDDGELCNFPISTEKENKLPYVIHYCQSYWLGKWFIGKYRLASDWLSCDRPLLLEPPKNIGKKYDFYIRPGGVPYGTKEKIPQTVVKREHFMICQLIARFNDAATWIKNQTCEEGKANYEKSFFFHFSLDPDNNEGGEKKEEP